MGRSRDWEDLGINRTEADDLNQIGQTGKVRGVRMNYQTYLNDFTAAPHVRYSVVQTVVDNGSFQEEFTVTKVVTL